MWLVDTAPLRPLTERNGQSTPHVGQLRHHRPRQVLVTPPGHGRSTKEIDIYYVSATNYWEQDPSDAVARTELPFAHLVDRNDPAYRQIVMAIVDFWHELGDPKAVDDEMVRAAIRIGRTRYERQQSSTPMEPETGIAPWRNKSTDPRAVVYYIRRGAMVKIGTTVNLRNRMATLLPEEVLAVEPGDHEVEAERHRRFRALRVPGQREWFYAGRELQEHIEEVLDRHGPPPPDLPTLPSASGILEA